MKQNHKIMVGVMFAFVIFIFLLLFFVDANESTWCVKGEMNYRNCISLVGNIGQPILWSFLSLLPIILILFFVRRETFMAWAIFAAIAFPIMLGGLLYAFNMPQSTGGWVSGPNEAQIASFLLPGLFIIISFVIIVVKSRTLRGK